MTLLKNDGSAPIRINKVDIVSWPSLTIKDGLNFGIGFGLALIIVIPVILVIASFIIALLLALLGGS